MQTDLYREEILEQWQNPQNFGVMDKPDLIVEQVNPLCGDEVTFYFKFSSPLSSSRKRGSRFSIRSRMTTDRNEKTIKDVCFTGSGCAISIASASILSENIKGKPISALVKITGEDVLKLVGGSIAPARLKCAFLALEAVKKLKIES